METLTVLNRQFGTTPNYGIEGRFIMQGIDQNTRHNMEVIADNCFYNICADFQRLVARLNCRDNFNEYDDALRVEKYLWAFERGVKAIHNLIKLGEKYAD